MTVMDYLTEWLEGCVRMNLRQSTYEGYKRTVRHYILPYIGEVILAELDTPAVDRMLQQILDKGYKPGTAAGAKRVLNTALDHAWKNGLIETNVVRNTVTRFDKPDPPPRPYTPGQMGALLNQTAETEWEILVMLGGLYGMRRSEVLGLRWRNVNLKERIFEVAEQLPFYMPPKTMVISQLPQPKSGRRCLPITELAVPFFERQMVLQASHREKAARRKRTYYENDLVVARTNGAPMAVNRVSSEFGRLLSELAMPHIRFQDLRHTAACNMHQLTGDFYTVGEVLGHTLSGMDARLGIPEDFSAPSVFPADVRLVRRREVLETYHRAVAEAMEELEQGE